MRDCVQLCRNLLIKTKKMKISFFLILQNYIGSFHKLAAKLQQLYPSHSFHMYVCFMLSNYCKYYYLLINFLVQLEIKFKFDYMLDRKSHRNVIYNNVILFYTFTIIFRACR